jgi:hypothetical protein
MSFDLFVGCFRNGNKATFRRSLVDEYLGPYVTERHPGCLTLTFDARSQSYLYVEDTPAIDGFSINRPCTSSKLYEALLSLLRRENLVLYMPGNCPPLIANPAVTPHLPKTMVDSMGPPVMLSSSNEIPKRIEEA